MDWELWVYGPGLVPVYQEFRTVGNTNATKLADDFILFEGKAAPVNN